MIVIIDYHMGNLHSVRKAFKRIGVETKISSNIEDIKNAKKLVLPGVGNFKHGMFKLNELGLIDILNQEVLNNKKPILGICLGMQLFTSFSEEGNVKGLCWIDATSKKFDFSKNTIKAKIPHMGWNTVLKSRESNLLKGINEENFFYFVHSYYVSTNKANEKLAVTKYKIEFTSIVEKENIMGVQFHPEKSHDSGLNLLKNFSKG
ncbi:MAG: imidazole glycerol phosphate synthase subunit HisH [Balneola sp.]